MSTSPPIQEIDLRLTPLQVVARWPRDRPLLALRSGSAWSTAGGSSHAATSAGPTEHWSRWSILAAPTAWHAVDAACGGAALDELETLLAGSRRPISPDTPCVPFVGGWIGYFAYELGQHLEPATQHGGRTATSAWPLLELARCPHALLHDHLLDRWLFVGAGDPASYVGMLERADPPVPGFDVGPWSSSFERSAYLAAVERTLEYIRAGDIFQANITQTLSARFTGSTRALAVRALGVSDAWYGAALELPSGRRLISMSPELFLTVDGRSRAVVTRPIKGTRPAHVDPRELADSAKDAAELNMIVDLMRNDLGRLCEFGSMHVPHQRRIESHPTVHHGVGEVRGRLRADVGLADLLRATFPGGSITGAPKIRAMQIINELEPVARGPYCGALGFLSDCGNVGLSIAIRTMMLTPDGAGADPDWSGTLAYGVGGGIVADSDPAAEYQESLDKAHILTLVTAAMPRPDTAVAPAS